MMKKIITYLEIIFYNYPMGKAIPCKDTEFLTKPIPYIAIVRFSKLQSKSTHSFISIHKCIGIKLSQLKNCDNIKVENGRVWCADELTIVVNDVEFKSLAQAYDFDFESTQILACWKFEKYAKLPYYLLDVLNEQYELKTVLKRAHKDKTTEYVFAKNKVNGMYGMTVTALYRDLFEILDNGEIVPLRDENGDKVRREYDDALNGVFLSPYWGMWVTSYARALLIDFICKFPNCIIQYDTDSLFFTTDSFESTQLLEYIKKYNEYTMESNKVLFNNNDVFKDLGTFEVDEYLLTDFKGLGSKRYIYRQYDKKSDSYIIDSVVSGCRKGTIASQFEFEYGTKVDDDLDNFFNFFRDGMKIDKEHGNKLTSKYINDYNGRETVEVVVSDYLGNYEKIKLEPCILLRPTEFNMGVTNNYVRFYKMIQNMYNNAPKSYCDMFDNIVDILDLNID